jgi:hypothetical protein
MYYHYTMRAVFTLRIRVSNTFLLWVSHTLSAVLTLQIRVSNTQLPFPESEIMLCLPSNLGYLTPRFYLKVIGEWFPLTLTLHSERKFAPG